MVKSSGKISFKGEPQAQLSFQNYIQFPIPNLNVTKEPASCQIFMIFIQGLLGLISCLPAVCQSKEEQPWMLTTTLQKSWGSIINLHSHFAKSFISIHHNPKVKSPIQLGSRDLVPLSLMSGFTTFSQKSSLLEMELGTKNNNIANTRKHQISTSKPYVALE